MLHKKIRIPRESANEILLALGSLHDAIEFEDMTKNDLDAKKNFGDIIKRCDECRKRIDDFIHISFDFHIPFYNYKTFNEFKSDLDKDMKERDKKFGSTYFDLLESEINENDRKINELVDSHTQIRDDLVTLIEKKHVLLKASELIRNNIAYGDFSESEAGENGIKQSSTSNLSFMTGVVNAEYELKMKRMIFRISRGHAVTTFYSLDINNDEYLLTSSVRQRGFSFVEGPSKELVQKNLPKLSSIIQSKEIDTFNTNKRIFTIIFTGGEEGILLQKILKVCEIFQASRYPVPKTSEVKEEIDNIVLDIKDKKNLIISIEKNLNDLIKLNNKLNNKKGYKYSLYKLYFEQQKMIYTTLNKCIVRDTFIDGQVWIPKDSLPEVEKLLKNIFVGKDNKLNANLEDLEINEEIQSPPTYIRTNEIN
jgi:vacuolar-type H+-ATPase subunit I/STV1